MGTVKSCICWHVCFTGKLPLLATEVEGAEAAKQSKQDCLTVFLSPPSLEVHEQRLRSYLTESDDEIAERQAVAAKEKAAATALGVFDAVVVNDELDLGFEQLCAAISTFRPDIITPADPGGKDSISGDQTLTKPHLLLCGPPGERTGGSSM
jgi:guanylate kinase